MEPLRSLRAILVAVLVVGMTVSASAAGARPASRRCGHIAIDYRPTPAEHYRKMFIRAPRSVRCGRARAVMRRYVRAPGPYDGSSCYHSYRDGWTCDAMTPGAWPVIQECVSGDARIVGRVHSKIKGPR